MITRTNIGVKPDGTPLVHYAVTGHALITGPIGGHVVLDDGTSYAVGDDVIEVDPEHAAEVACKIGQRFAAEGHPKHTDGEPFVHSCDLCGGE